MSSSVLLPPELWRRILEDAASPPGGLLTSWNYRLSDKLFRGWEELEWGDPGIHTKLSIVLVCRQWRTIGTEFLYQWIPFTEPHRAKILLEGFRRSAGVAEIESRPAYGWWVKRVDVSGGMIDENDIETLFDFLEQCSRVELVIPVPPFGSISGIIERRLTELQASRFQHSLRHLRLRAIRPSVAPPPSPTTLPALTSLSIAFSLIKGQVMPDWYFPALRFLKLFKIGDTFVPCLIPFLNHHGPLLIGLHLRSYGGLEKLPEILTKTSSLQSLVMDEEDLLVLRLTEVSFPSILHLGLQPIGEGGTEESYVVGDITDSFRILFLCQVFPNLKSVRLLAVQDEASFETKWPELLALCSAHNVRLSGKE